MKKLQWMTLDNAAKIFPASQRRHWSNVFRISATLTDAVDVACLQQTLEDTIKRFPSLAVCIKPGFFWYYIEQIPHAPEILDEKPYPLSRMPFDDIRKCAFRVLVYKNRIAVEFFHAITDGNGGLVFVKTFVSEYLRRKYGVAIPCEDGILDIHEAPRKEEAEDSFKKYAGPVKASRSAPDSFRIYAKREPDGYKTNTTFIFDAEDIHRRAKEQGVTVTAYFAAILLMAAMRQQSQTVKRTNQIQPVFVTIPVNLRKMFPSESLRNFMLFANPGIDPRLGEYTFEEICQLLHHQMKIMITPKNMAALMAKNVGDEKPVILRAMPLFLKNIVMRMVFDAVGERKACFSFSNLGVVNVPQEFRQYVERMDFVIGTQAQSPYNIGAITYGNKLYINLIRNIEQPLLEKELYAVLKELGIRPRAESNTRPKGEPYVLY